MWLFTLFLILPVVVSDLCPRGSTISPCSCAETFFRWQNGVQFLCHGMKTYESIGKVVDAMGGEKTPTIFIIENSVLSYLPADVFQGLQVQILRIKSSTLQSLTDTDVAFVGLEDSLTTLTLTQATLLSDWDWSILKNLKKLELISIAKGNLRVIDDGVLQMSADTLKVISFDLSKISYLGDNAFAQFTNLKEFVVSNNNIKSVKRSMFANPAPNLNEIDLRNNPLEHLPADFFTNMPALSYVFLSFTGMVILDEKVFKPVWSKLYIFEFSGNKLVCDCRLSWVLKEKFPVNLYAWCNTPKKLYYRKIDTLKPHELVCFL